MIGRSVPRRDAAAERTWDGADSQRGVADADELLRRIELTVTRRLDGLLQGSRLGLLPGPGGEAGDSREYTLGDDVRRMDWPVTARTTVPHVRETIADRELETWILVDLSASLDFGTALCEKRELAIAAAGSFASLTVRGGGRVGALIAQGPTVRRLPARSGPAAVHALLRKLVDSPRAQPGETGDFVAAAEALRRPVRKRGLVVVVSDFLPGPGADADRWDRPLRALSHRHDVLAVEVLDPRELELPDAGVLMLQDPETGRVLEVSTRSKGLRERYAHAAAQQRAEIAGRLRSAGAGRLQLRTDRDWLADLVRFAHARRVGHAGNRRAGVR